MLSILSRDASPLHAAAGNGSAGLLQDLIGRGADANTCDKYGNAPLHLAVSRGDMDCINVLLPFTDTTILNGCNRLGQTPIKVAVSNRHIDGVRLLLSAARRPGQSVTIIRLPVT